VIPLLLDQLPTGVWLDAGAWSAAMMAMTKTQTGTSTKIPTPTLGAEILVRGRVAEVAAF